MPGDPYAEAFKAATPPAIGPAPVVSPYAEAFKSPYADIFTPKGFTRDAAKVSDAPQFTVPAPALPTPKPVDTSKLFSGFVAQTGAKSPVNTSTFTPLIPQHDGTIKTPIQKVLDRKESIGPTPEGHLKNMSDDLNAEAKSLGDLSMKLDTLKKAGFPTQKSADNFNAMVDEYNTRSAAFLPKTDSYNADVAKYNTEQASQQVPNGLQKFMIDTATPGYGDPKKIINPVTDFLGGVIDDTGKRMSDYFSTFGTGDQIKFYSKGAEAVLGLANLVLMPISAAFKLGENIPMVGSGVKFVEGAFTLLDMSFVQGMKQTLALVPNSILTQSQKDDLAPALGHVASFVTQIAMGEKIHEAMPALKAKADALRIAITKDIVTTTYPGGEIYFRGGEAKDISQIIFTPEEKAMIASDPTMAKIARAMEDGTTLRISFREILTWEDKPIWAKIKSFFGGEKALPLEISDTGRSSYKVGPRLPEKGEVPSPTPPVTETHPTLLKETAASLALHGADVTSLAHQENLGLSPVQSEAIIKEAKAGEPLPQIQLRGSTLPIESQGKHSVIMSSTVPELSRRSTPPSIKNAATPTPAELTSTRYTRLASVKNIDSISHVTTLVEESQLAKEPFTNDIRKATGLEPEVRAKSLDSALDKITRVTARGGSHTEISDYVAGRITVKPSEVDEKIDAIKKNFDVTTIDDNRQNTKRLGYYGVNIRVELPNGLPAEIQVHTQGSLGHSLTTHGLYEKYRNVPESEMTKEQRADREKDHEHGQALAKELRDKEGAHTGKDRTEKNPLRKPRDGDKVSFHDYKDGKISGVKDGTFTVEKTITLGNGSEKILLSDENGKEVWATAESVKIISKNIESWNNAPGAGGNSSVEGNTTKNQGSTATNVEDDISAYSKMPPEDQHTVDSLTSKLRDRYQATGPSDLEGFTRADKAFAEIVSTLLESRPGTRIFMPEENGQGGGYRITASPSTFPDFIPPPLRNMEDFKKVVGVLDPTKIQYPTRANATALRALVDVLLDQVDYQLGIETGDIRSEILKLYEKADTSTEEETAASVRGGDAGGEGQPGADGGGKIKLSSKIEGELDIVLDEVKHDPGLSPAWKSMQKKVHRGGTLDLTGPEMKELRAELANIVDKDRDEFPASSRGAQKMINKIDALKNTQGGFINPEELAKMVGDKAAEIKALIEETQKKIEITDDLTHDLILLEGSAQADIESTQKTIDKIKQAGGLNAADDTAIYHDIEAALNPSVKAEALTPSQQAIRDRFIDPLLKVNTALFKNIKDIGYEIESEGHIHREIKGRGGATEKLLSGKKKAGASGGGLLTKSDSSFKGRSMFAYTDSAGVRHIVHEGEHVTEFRDGKKIDLGPIGAKIPPKVREFFDPSVRGALEKLAKDLGVTHKRVATGKSEGLGGQRAGVSFTGADLIKTRLSPDQVLAHELGHQIDHKYGMKDFMKEERYDATRKREIAAEMRALADERFKGSEEVSDNFKKYVRKGTEKMAVMFEAYISNPEMFQRVAPHLYDDFHDFIGSHAELKPFLAIEGSVQLGSQTHGGQLVRGLKGKTFIDRFGKRYTKGEATTKEITQHAGLEYHESAISSAVTQFLRLSKINRAVQFLESWKERPDASQVLGKMNQPDAPLPEHWVPFQTPQFRGYAGEPKTVAAVDSFYHNSANNPNILEKSLKAMNRVLTSAIFYNPVAHPLNAIQTGVVDFAPHLVNPLAYPAVARSFMRAYNAIFAKNGDYIYALQHGAPILSTTVNSQSLATGMRKMLEEELGKDAAFADKLAHALTFENAKDMMHAMGNKWHSMAFVWTDMMSLAATYTRMETRGMSFEEATADTSRFQPDYRLPPKLKGALNSGFNPLFAANYHYGILKSLGSMVKDIVAPGEGQTTGKGNTQRADATARAAMLALLTIVFFPWLTKEAKKLTGNVYSYVSPSGSSKVLTDAYGFAKGTVNPSTFAESVVGFTPFVKGALELYGNVDWFTRRPIYGNPPAIGMPQFLTSLVAPLDAASRMTPEDFALSFANVHSPASSPGKRALDTQIYDEKPALLTIVKDLMLAGKIDEANARMKDFNDRIINNYQNWMVEKGDPQLNTPEQINELLKADGLATPGFKALNNATARAAAKGPKKPSLLDTIKSAF